MESIKRVFQMLNMLQKGDEIPVKYFAEKFQVTTKTVHSYKSTLVNAGYDIQSSRGRNASYKLNQMVNVKSHISSERVIEAMEKALNYSETTGDFETASVINSIIYQIETDDTEQKSEKVSIDKEKINAIRTEASVMFIEDALYAIKRTRLMYIRYKSLSSGEVKERVIEPYSKMKYAGAEYVIAYCREAMDWRYFHSLRVKDYSILSERFDKRPFNPDNIYERFGLIEGKGFHIKIRLYGIRAEIAKERKIDSSQEITEIEGGVELTAFIRSENEILSWVLSMGRNAEVIEPQWFVHNVRKEVDSMRKLYT